MPKASAFSTFSLIFTVSKLETIDCCLLIRSYEIEIIGCVAGISQRKFVVGELIDTNNRTITERASFSTFTLYETIMYERGISIGHSNQVLRHRKAKTYGNQGFVFRFGTLPVANYFGTYTIIRDFSFRILYWYIFVRTCNE